MKATIVDLRYRMKDVLRAIERGETVTVLYRGKEKAKLMPISTRAGSSVGSAVRTTDQPFFGMWSDREELDDPASYVRDLREPRQVLARLPAKKPPSVQKPR